MKFSRVLSSFCTALVLSSCAYVIPPDENKPRNNVVLGTSHRPQLNDDMGVDPKAPQSALTPHNPPPQNVAQNAAPMLPPVDDATKAQAEQEMAQAPQAPLVPTSMPPVSGRHVPVENLQVAQNDTPSLMNVPARPVLTGPDSTKERLTAVQSDLVQDRGDATVAKDTLARDAAAEPSMLSQLPATDAVVPPNDPIMAKPVVVTPAVTPTISVAPKPGASIAPLENIPPQAMVTIKPLPPETTGSILAPVATAPVTTASTTYIASVPHFAPPTPLNNASMPTATVANAAPIALMPAKVAPITLNHPVENVAAQDLPAPAVSYAPAAAPAAPMVMASSGRPNVTQGDFDPLAAADNAPATNAAGSGTTTISTPSTYASDGYMTQSRYAARRY